MFANGKMLPAEKREAVAKYFAKTTKLSYQTTFDSTRISMGLLLART